MSGRVRRIYVASSWRNLYQPEVVDRLRAEGHEVYDFRNPHGPGAGGGFAWAEIDDSWQEWTKREYLEALEHPRAVEGFRRDFEAMTWADTFVLVLPSGASSHLEFGWACGAGRDAHILLAPGEPELMRKMATALHASIRDLLEALR